MSTATNKDKGAGVRFPPPLIPLGSLLTGYLADTVSPLPVGEAAIIRIIGAGMLVLALLAIALAALALHRAKTAIEPWKPTSVILTRGIFAVSRNPIYLAFCWASIGIGLLLNSWWLILGVIPTVFLIYCLVIRREEAYLEARFGDDYLQYKSRVRRWI